MGVQRRSLGILTANLVRNRFASTHYPSQTKFDYVQTVSAVLLHE